MTFPNNMLEFPTSILGTVIEIIKIFERLFTTFGNTVLVVILKFN